MSIFTYILMVLVSFLSCKKIVLLHTYLFKLSGVMVILLILISYFYVQSYFLTIISIVVMLASIEGMIIFIKYGYVDPNVKSIFSIK